MDEFVLKKSKFEPFSLFEWNISFLDVPIEQHLKTLTEKVSVSEDESQFDWKR